MNFQKLTLALSLAVTILACDAADVAPSRDKADRLQALANSDYKASIDEALSLVSDSDTNVAVTAAGILADALVMSDHQMNSDLELMPWQRKMMEDHTKVREGLYGALNDQRQEVREIAATMLASLSDERALEIIDRQAQEGVYDDSEAVNYLGLARPQVSATYIIAYLEKGSDKAQESAVQYLGRNREFQSQVVDKVLMNDSSAIEVRRQAADLLSEYDPNFTTYAVELLRKADLPVEVYRSISEGYLENILTPDPDIKNSMESRLDQYIIDGRLDNVEIQQLIEIRQSLKRR